MTRNDGGDWGPGGKYNSDNWGCGAALLAPLLALVALLVAVTS